MTAIEACSTVRAVAGFLNHSLKIINSGGRIETHFSLCKEM